jgi:hypothetical protein
VEDAVGMAVDGLWGHAAGLVEKVRERQQAALPDEYLRQTFTCAGCNNKFAIDDMEMVHPDNGFGTCRNCFKFLWTAGKEKAATLAKNTARRARAAGQQRAQQAPPKPPRKPPWEVLGVASDASADQIKKAYRKQAMQWHPDRVPPGASSHEREQSRLMFEEITRARDVMMSVRQPPRE